MPLVVPVMLLLILGAVTLASRSTSSFLAASKQSDAQAAKEAAESGMFRVLSRLSPIGKGASDAYLSFLLAAKWKDGNWAIIKDVDIAKIPQELTNCNLATRGRTATQVLPISKDTYDKVISNTIGTSVEGGRTLRYRVLEYIPPQPPGTTPLPSACNSAYIATVSGGEARITVEGIVEKEGKQLASQSLTRRFEIQASPLIETSAMRPGPPVSLRIEQTGTALGNVTPWIEKETGDKSITEITSLSKMLPQCKSCSPSIAGGNANYFPTSDGQPTDLPRFPTAATPPVGDPNRAAYTSAPVINTSTLIDSRSTTPPLLQSAK